MKDPQKHNWRLFIFLYAENKYIGSSAGADSIDYRQNAFADRVGLKPSTTESLLLFWSNPKEDDNVRLLNGPRVNQKDADTLGC